MRPGSSTHTLSASTSRRSFATFLLRRLLQSVGLLAGVVTLVFLFAHLLPGDPAQAFLSPNIPPAVADRIREQFGLDRSLPAQYSAWLLSVLRGDLGHSFSQNESVATILLRVFPNSVVLGGAALLAEVLFALVLLFVALSRPGSFVDRSISRGSLLAFTLPTFWVGYILLWVFAYSLRLLPASQMGSTDTEQIGGIALIADRATHLLLPVLTIALPGSAGLTRYVRAGVGSVLDSEFVLAAKSLGLRRREIVVRYILPNALGTGITYLGIEFGLLLAGVVVTETLFAWPGMGRLIVMATFARDYPLLLGATCFAGSVVILGNLLADVANALIDPRIRSVR